MHGMVTKKMGRNVMHGLFFFFKLIKTSFRCGHEPQMDFFCYRLQIFESLKVSRESLEWLKSRVVLYRVPVFSL